MVQTFKRFFWLAVLTAGILDAGAFAIIGPNNEVPKSGHRLQSKPEH